MTAREVVLGFGAHNGIADSPEWLRLTEQADRDGLDLFSLSDHPYIGSGLDAYAAVGLALGRTQRITGFANVTNLPTRPPAMLARTVGCVEKTAPLCVKASGGEVSNTYQPTIMREYTSRTNAAYTQPTAVRT